MKNQKGITLVALSITIILFTVVLATITFSSISSLQLRRLNNMYADINVVQGRLDNYYIKNKGKLPIYTDQEVKVDSAMQIVIHSFNKIMANIVSDSTGIDVRKNPNDSLPTITVDSYEVDAGGNPVNTYTYKIIKFVEQDDSGKSVNLLGSFTLNNYYQNAAGVKDYYLTNLQSHQVYYCTIGVDNIITGVQASEDEEDIRFSIPFSSDVYRDISVPLKDITGK